MNLDWKKLAEEYAEKDWSFSSAFAWEKVVNENPTPFHLIQYVEQLRLSGNYFEAEKVMEKIKTDEIPDKYRFVFYIRKGKLHEDQGQIDEAILSYRTSIDLKIDDTYPYIFLASALLKKSRLTEAEEVLVEALNKKGDIDEVHYNLSFVYARKGDFIQAIASMKECLKLDATFPNARTWLDDFENMQLK